MSAPRRSWLLGAFGPPPESFSCCSWATIGRLLGYLESCWADIGRSLAALGRLLVSLGPAARRIFPNTRGQRQRECFATLRHFGTILLVVRRRIGDTFHVLQYFDNLPEDGERFRQIHNGLQGGHCVPDECGCVRCHGERNKLGKEDILSIFCMKMAAIAPV